MIHHRNDEQIPESIITALYSHAVPKEDLNSAMENLINFDQNANIFVENQKSQEKLNETTIMNNFSTPNQEVTVETDLSRKKSFTEISRFLYYFNINTCKILKYDLFSSQFQIVKEIKDNIGLQFCLASYTQSLHAMAYFLTNNDPTNQDRYSKTYAQHAIDCIKNYNISSTFVPDFEIPPLLSIPIGEEPKTPTSIATSTSKLFVGGQKDIQIIPLYRYASNKPHKIPLPANDEQYSLAYVKNIQTTAANPADNKEFLLFSSISTPASFVDPNDGSHYPIRISYRNRTSFKAYPFSPPIVSDGQYLYSIDFGSSPRVKTFFFMNKEIFYIRSISLQKGKNELKSPFKDLLPWKLKDTASIATNGLFISFLFEIPQTEYSICRIFLIRNGIHVRDEVVHSPAKINAWTFDLKRPSHCLIVESMMLLIDSRFTLPSFFVGFDDQLLDIQNMENKTESIIEHFSYELSIYSTYFIGCGGWPSLNFNNIPDIEPLESIICNLIDSKNKRISQAFLLFLPFKIMNGDCDTEILLKILDKFIDVFYDINYEYLHRQIVFSFLVSFDYFAKIDLEKSSTLLSKIIFTEQFSVLLFKYLPNSNYLTKSLTTVSLKVLCELALDSSFIFASDATSLLRQIQSDLILNENQMLMTFIQVVLDHFIKDLKLFMDGKWNEQRLLSSISFNIFKELILVVENIRYDYQFSVYTIIEFFSIGSCVRKNCCSLIFKVVERSIHFAFEMLLHKIEEDKSFYKFEKDFIVFEEFKGKNRNLQFDHFGLDEKIVNEFQKVIDNSYVANLDDSFIINEINIILDKVRTGKLTEEKFIEKCRNVSEIQPQLFANISHYFKNDIDFNVLDQDKSICIKFITLFSSSIYQDSSSFRSVFIYFVPQIYHLRQYFLMVPNEIISNFVPNFKLWYFLMPEFLIRSEITFEMIDKLPTRALLYSEQTFFSISQNIQKVDMKFNENRMLRSLLLLNIIKPNIKFNFNEEEEETNEKDRNKNKIENEINFKNLVLKCLITGNYEIVRQTMMLILYLIESVDLSIIDSCLEFIGTYLNEEKIMFYYQTDRLTCFQNCFLIADYLKAIFNKITIDSYFKRIESKGGFSYAQKLALFLVMNNSIDTLRMNCHVSAISMNGQKFDGIVTFFDDKNIAIETEDHSIQYISEFDTYDCNFQSYFQFNSKIVKDLNFVKKMIIEFEPNLSFHNIFKYAALKEFMLIKEFCSLFNEEEISMIAFKINRSLISLNQSINDFSQLMIFHMTPLPIFAFNHSQNEFSVKPHRATVETMRNSFFNRTQQKDLKNVEISDTLISFDESSFYVSTPLHPTADMRMTFNVHSSVTMDPQLILTVCMLGKSRNAFYRSQPIICDSSNEALIEMRPHLHSVLIRNNSLQDVNIFLQPSCEFIFITARLAASTIVDYTFEYGFGTETKSNYAEILIPRICDDDDDFVLPFQTSSIFVDAQMQEDTNRIVSHFALEIILNFPQFECTHKYVSFALLNADQMPFDTNVDLKSMKKCQFTSFVEKVLYSIKDDPDKRSYFIDFLMLEIEAKWNRYKKSAFGPYNMTASIFSENINFQLLKQGNIYVISNNCVYFNPSEKQLKEFSGVTFIIRSDDITDSVIEFFVRVRHVVSMLLIVSNSNTFLVENITRLLKIIHKENEPFIASLDSIIGVINRLIPKHRIANIRRKSYSSNNNRLSRKQSHGLCYIGVTSIDVESKGLLNFSINPIETKKKLTVSQFNVDDVENYVDCHPAIISPPSSLNENEIVLEKKIMKINEWVTLCFPFYFEDNVDNLDAQIEMFFSMNNSLKCFPLTNFLDQLFFCNSSEYRIDDANRFNDQENVIYFENCPLQDDEFIYLNIIFDENNNKHTSFEISLDEAFNSPATIDCTSQSLIIPPLTFYIRFNQSEVDPQNIKFRWKKFVFNEESFYNQIQNEVFKWKPCFSHQILLSFPNNEIMTPELYNFLPISTLISYEIASFFLHILRQKPKYIEDHTFDYNFNSSAIPETSEEKILSFLPELNYTPVTNYKPKNCEEAAFVAALLYSSPKELNYTIPYSFWKDICDLNSPPNLIFSRLTAIYQKIEPTYLRMICTKNNFSDPETVSNCIIWKGIDDERKKWIADYLSQLTPFVLNLFVECITGHWGTKSLLQSENSYIIIQNVDEKDFLEFHQSIQVIAVGKYVQRYSLINDLKLRMHQSITTMYL